jgi:hypothetical protein
MRIFLAILIAGLGIAVALPVAGYQTHHAYSNCADSYFSPQYPCTVYKRPIWALPLAVMIGALGIGAAAAVATRRPTSGATLPSAPRNTPIDPPPSGQTKQGNTIQTETPKVKFNFDWLKQ